MELGLNWPVESPYVPERHTDILHLVRTEIRVNKFKVL